MTRGLPLAALALAFAAGGCATSDGGAADAAQNGLADATTVVDGAPGAPDARPGSIDAAVNLADAAVIDAVPIPDADPPDADPPDADPPDADPPDADPPDAACTPVWTSLLTNGDFEAGSTGWSQTGGTLIEQVGAGFPWANTNDGTWGAALGGVNFADQQLTQAVSVPANATALRLRGALCFVTEESTPFDAYDTLTIQVQGGTVDEIVYSNLDALGSCSWSAFVLDAPTAHAGENITLSFDAQGDISLITTFGFDSLVLESLACP